MNLIEEIKNLETNNKCECWELANTVRSIISSKVDRNYISESTAAGGALRYVECKCRLCGREWTER